MTAGIEGYDRNIAGFIHSSQSLDFQRVCSDFIPYLPPTGRRILDAGSGAGQNAAALSKLGYAVTAIEPMDEFRDAAQCAYDATSVNWLKGSLPHLSCLRPGIDTFEFVLIEAVWHHLDNDQRLQAASTLACLLSVGGRCAISLRQGPAGLGSCVYPTDVYQTGHLFETQGLTCLFTSRNQNSILPDKEDVTWSRIVLQKLSTAR